MNLRAPFAGTVVGVPHAIDETVSAGTPLIVLEAMKMEHELLSDRDGTLQRLEVSVGDAVTEGQLLAVLAAAGEVGQQPPTPDRERERNPPQASRDDLHDPAPQESRDDLRAVRERHAIGLDAGRPEAVGKRHASGRRTARENLHELLDEGSFVEYGPLIFAAQERRRSLQELIERTPADGLVGGVGTIDGEECVAMSYDYTVLAGTQGMRNHLKKDRLFELAQRRRLPVVLFAEGGGGRPGDVDSRSSRGSTAAPFISSQSSAGSCRWSGSRRATASPATRRCWAAATS